MLFAFQAIADGKVGDAVESGLGGLVSLAGASFAWRRYVRKSSGPRRRRIGSSEALRVDASELEAEARLHPPCVACREPVVTGGTCAECEAAVHVTCAKRHHTEAHELSVGAYR